MYIELVYIYQHHLSQQNLFFIFVWWIIFNVEKPHRFTKYNPGTYDLVISVSLLHVLGIYNFGRNPPSFEKIGGCLNQIG